MWWTDAAHRKVYSCGTPAPFSADPGGRRRMNVDRHYKAFACFFSLTLFVFPFPTNSFFPPPKVILDKQNLCFRQLLRSYFSLPSFLSAPPPSSPPSSSHINT